MAPVFKLESGATLTLEEWFESSEKYNQDHLPILESYVREQAENGTNDVEVNLVILHMYKFHISHINFDITCIILLKCLTSLPNSDFSRAKYLLVSKQKENSRLKDIIELGDLLMNSKFTLFWQLAKKHETLLLYIREFCDKIRKYICYIIGINYNELQYEVIKAFLGDENDDNIYHYMKLYGFIVEQNMVKIPNDFEDTEV